jgi:uncharacterized membrane protein
MPFFNRERSADPRIRDEIGGAVVLAGGALFWSAGIFVPAVLHSLGLGGPMAVLARLVYAPLCHQLPSRSFAIDGVPLSVCARCTAIYLTFAAVAVVFVFSSRLRGFHAFRVAPLVACLLPMLLDVACDALGVRTSDVWSRIATGSCAGTGLGLFVVSGWLEAWREFRRLPVPSTRIKEVPA